MSEQTQSDELLNFFKALADANRLKIVGLLAHQPYTVEQLAELLKLGASTVSHHLTKLAKAGLVTARSEQYYNVYSLHTDAIQLMARRLLSHDLPSFAHDIDRTAYDRKVLAAFTRRDGSLKAFPAQQKKLLVLLNYVVDAFEVGKHYTEKQVNAILAQFNADTAKLRRDLVDYHLMARESSGGAYWRIE